MECSRSDAEPDLSLRFEKAWQLLHCTLRSLKSLWKGIWLFCWRDYMEREKPWDPVEKEKGAALPEFQLSSTFQPLSLGCRMWVRHLGRARWPPDDHSPSWRHKEQKNHLAEPTWPRELWEIKKKTKLSFFDKPLHFVIVCCATVDKQKRRHHKLSDRKMIQTNILIWYAH